MTSYYRLSLTTVFYLVSGLICQAQFPPPAGQPGTTALYKDSSIFINWAKSCTVEVGYIDIADTSRYYGGSNKADYGSATDGIGKADDHVVSLGDHGMATLFFDPPVKNGAGADFAVFENGLSDSFLELGFVEVSSDGTRFVRFPATSLTQDTLQISTFGNTDATKINNLAGKYRLYYGTPFDLEELKDSTGIDLNHITHIRIIDVIGCIKPAYATFDASGHIINDPWPTPFNTGGFDLDAIGVIHEYTFEQQKEWVQFYPNPIPDQLNITNVSGKKVVFSIITMDGAIVFHQTFNNATERFDLSSLRPGIYIGKCVLSDGSVVLKKLIKL